MKLSKAESKEKTLKHKGDVKAKEVMQFQAIRELSQK
jgi:hypothetical protein